MEPARLWPDRPVDTMQTFFIRIADGADRPSAFAAALRALKAVRWHDFGRYTLRLPPAGPWLVVDWHASVLELPSDALEAISERLRAELVAVSAVSGHGRSGGRLFLRRFVSGRTVPGNPADTAHFDPEHLPASFAVEQLPEFAAALRLPEETLPADVPSLDITCVPAKLAVWALVLVFGGLAAVLYA